MAIFREGLVIHVTSDGLPRFLTNAGNDLLFSKSTIKKLYPKAFGVLRSNSEKYRQKDKTVAKTYLEKQQKDDAKPPVHLRLIFRGTKSPPKADTAWIESSGYADYCRDEGACLLKLLALIEKRRARRSETIDEIFGVL